MGSIPERKLMHISGKSLFRHSGDSEGSIETSILDAGHQEITQLRLKLEETEQKCKILEVENERINSDLINERAKTFRLEKKLQFVKDNQEVFMRLKEAYINMKYNEATGRRMIEIREKGMQTWPGVLCKACLETEEVKRQVEVLVNKYSEMFVVSPSEMERLINTVKYLKDLIARRENSWSANYEKENNLRTRVGLLERENCTLREMLLKNHDSTVNKEVLEETLDEIRQVSVKDAEILKKIIIKYEKRFKEIVENQTLNLSHSLIDKDMSIVGQIVSSDKTNSDSLASRHITVEKPCPSRRPSSPLRCFRDDTRRFGKDNIENCTVSTIMMMDCLFD